MAMLGEAILLPARMVCMSIYLAGFIASENPTACPKPLDTGRKRPG